MKVVQQVRMIFLVIFLLGGSLGIAVGAEAGALRVGAVKVDITPADPTQLTNQWGVPFVGVHDKTYARVLVVSNGATSAVIIGIDTVEVTDATEFVARIAKETGIPAANIVVTATHDHNAPIVGMSDISGMHKAGPGGAAFLAKLYDDLVKAVKQSQANLQPARLGVATGISSINVNRDQPQPDGGYRMGKDPMGPSDKTVWVLKFESMSGEPIALLINYAVHSTVIGMKNNLLTGEVAGASARFVEENYKDKVVAVWTLSAAGDQGPIVSDAMSTPSNFEPVNVLGQILGEEIVRVADGMNSKTMISQGRIWGAEKAVTCPGQKAAGQGPGGPGGPGGSGGPDDHGGPGGPGGQGGEPRGPMKMVDSDPVHFQIGVLMIDKIALTRVSAEVVTKIYQEVRQQSPFSNTLMLTLANGRAGYITDDAAYDVGKPESGMSSMKKGCGEATIVNGLSDLLRQY
jgi:hypothetical protein